MPRIRRYVGVLSVLGALALLFAMVFASPAAQAKKEGPKPEKIKGDLIVDHGGGYPGEEQTVSADVKGNLIVRAGADGSATAAFLDQVAVGGDLIVEDGGVAVVVDGVVVNNNVFVNPGGAFGGDAATTTTIKGGVEAVECSAFRLNNAEVDGDVLVSGCVGVLEVGTPPQLQDQVVDILNSTIKGSVTYTGNQGPVLLVGAPDYPNDIKGDLWFTDNLAESNVEPYNPGLIWVYDNTIGGSADISRNIARNIYIGNNSITQDLACAANEPLPLYVETNTVGGTNMCVY